MDTLGVSRVRRCLNAAGVSADRTCPGVFIYACKVELREKGLFICTSVCMNAYIVFSISKSIS